jgi:hypothetical protein
MSAQIDPKLERRRRQEANTKISVSGLITPITQQIKNFSIDSAARASVLSGSGGQKWSEVGPTS